jgi:hypothetical protein
MDTFWILAGVGFFAVSYAMVHFFDWLAVEE